MSIVHEYFYGEKKLQSGRNRKKQLVPVETEKKSSDPVETEKNRSDPVETKKKQVRSGRNWKKNRSDPVETEKKNDKRLSDPQHGGWSTESFLNISYAKNKIILSIFFC